MPRRGVVGARTQPSVPAGAGCQRGKGERRGERGEERGEGRGEESLFADVSAAPQPHSRRPSVRSKCNRPLRRGRASMQDSRAWPAACVVSVVGRDSGKTWSRCRRRSARKGKCLMRDFRRTDVLEQTSRERDEGKGSPSCWTNIVEGTWAIACLFLKSAEMVGCNSTSNDLKGPLSSSREPASPNDWALARLETWTLPTLPGPESRHNPAQDTCASIGSGVAQQSRRM